MSGPNYSKIARSIGRAFIQFDHVKAVLEKLRDLVETDFDMGEPDILFIVGDPGTGKTWLAKRFAADYPRREHDTS